MGGPQSHSFGWPDLEPGGFHSPEVVGLRFSKNNARAVRR